MYNKIGNIDLETSAKYQSPIQTGIRFYNTDTGIAQLEFNLTRNHYPLMISEKNTHSFIILKTNEDHYIVDNIEYSDPLRGKVSYTIPNEFLSLPGKVHGQLYINVRGTEDVITEVDFYFDIENAVINSLPVVEKVRIIRSFAELQQSVNVEVNEIKERLTDGKRTIEQLKETLQEGLTKITSTKDSSIKEITDLKNSTTAEMDKLKKSTLSDINSAKTDAINSVESLNAEDTSDWQKYKVTEQDGIRIWLNTLNAPLENLDTGFYECAMPKEVSSLGLPIEVASSICEIDITKGKDNRKQIKLIQSYNKLTWIKTIDTNGVDRGWSQFVTQDNLNKRQNIGLLNSSVFALNCGSYECIVPADNSVSKTPKVDLNMNYVAHVDVYEGANSKVIKLFDIKNNDEYRAVLDSNGVSNGWQKIYSYPDNTKPFYDTKWVNWQLENGTVDRSLTIGNGTLYQNQYRVVKMFDITIVYLRINVTNFIDSSVVGRIPSKLVNKAQTGFLRSGLTQYPIVYTIDVDGSIRLYYNSNDKEKWDSKGYAIGSTNWIVDTNDFFVDTPGTTYIEGESPEDLVDTDFLPNMEELPTSDLINDEEDE